MGGVSSTVVDVWGWDGRDQQHSSGCVGWDGRVSSTVVHVWGGMGGSAAQ